MFPDITEGINWKVFLWLYYLRHQLFTVGTNHTCKKSPWFAWILPNMQYSFPNHWSMQIIFYLPDSETFFDSEQHKHPYLIQKESMVPSMFEVWNKNIFSLVATIFFPPIQLDKKVSSYWCHLMQKCLN